MSVFALAFRYCRQWLPLLCVLLASASVVGSLQLPQLRKLQQEKVPLSLEALRQEEKQERMRLAILQKMPTLGFDNLVADWTFLQVAQYFGDDDAREIAGYGLTLDYFDLILERDPRFREAYLFLATAGSLFAAQPKETDLLIERGLPLLTPTVPEQSYWIWRYKGMNELLFLENTQGQAQRSFTKAAEWASVYADEESQRAAQSSRKTALFLAQNSQSKKAKVTAWQMILQTAQDDRTRKQVIRQIEKLGGRVVVRSDGAIGVIPPAED